MKGGPFLPPSSGPKRKGISRAFCTHSFQAPGWVSEDCDAEQTKVGFQLAGQLAQPPTPPFPCLAAVPCRLPGSFPYQIRCLFTCRCRGGVPALSGGLQNKNGETHLSFPFSSLTVGKILPFWLDLGNLKQNTRMWAVATLKSMLGLKFNQKEVFPPQLATKAHIPLKILKENCDTPTKGR